jgi:hypothetical protein
MTSKTAKTAVKRKFAILKLFLVIVAAGVIGIGCHEGAEGDRCNPDLPPNSDECNSGLTCQVPSTCVEAYCCPMTLSSSTNGYCNGQLCPAAADAGH